MKACEKLINYILTIAWVLTLTAYIILCKECGKIHVILFALPFLFYVFSSWKLDNSFDFRQNLAIRFPIFNIFIILISFFITPYLQDFAVERFPGQFEVRQQIFSLLFILTLFAGKNLSPTKLAKQLLNMAIIVCTVVLIWRIYEVSIIYSTLIGIVALILSMFPRKSESFITKLHKEAAALKSSKASDNFWICCFNDSELSEELRWKAFDHINNEDILTDFFINHISGRTHFTNSSNPQSIIKNTTAISITKIEEVNEYPKLFIKIKKWENRLRLFLYFTEHQKLKCIDECDDMQFLEKALTMGNVNIELSERNQNPKQIFFDNICNKMNFK